MKNSKKEDLEKKMVNVFEVEQLEERLEMSWLGGAVVVDNSQYSTPNETVPNYEI